MTYKLTSGTSIILVSDGAYIPADTNNSDYIDYLSWIALGNSPEPADIPLAAIPEIVSMHQARRALLAFNLLSTVNAAVATMPGAAGDAARIDWEFSVNVRRTNPLVKGLQSALGLSDSVLDQLFIAASSIE